MKGLVWGTRTPAVAVRLCLWTVSVKAFYQKHQEWQGHSENQQYQGRIDPVDFAPWPTQQGQPKDRAHNKHSGVGIPSDR